MENITGDSIAYGCAAVGMLSYVAFLWAMTRGWVVPSARLLFIVRMVCLAFLLVPVGMRFYFSEQIILLLSVVCVVLGGLVKLRRKMGL